MSMTNRSADAIVGPGVIAKAPTGKPGALCMPNTSEMPNRSISPSSTIALPPAPPSSAGWKISATVPSKLRVSQRYRPAPSSIAVWPSCPQACIAPGVCDAHGLPLVSATGNASMSARNPMVLPAPLPSPCRSPCRDRVRGRRRRSGRSPSRPRRTRTPGACRRRIAPCDARRREFPGGGGDRAAIR